MPTIDYEKIADEVVDGNFQYLMKCLYDPYFDVHHVYTIPNISYPFYSDEYTTFNLLEVIALKVGCGHVGNEYVLIIEKLLSKGLNLADLSDHALAVAFSLICGSYNEPPIELINLLVEHGAVINSPSSIDEYYMRIPLFEAASLGHVQTMRRLCELGADVNPSEGTRDWGTPLEACLEVHSGDYSENSELIYETLMTLLEFNYQMSAYEFIEYFKHVSIDEAEDMACLKACLDVSLADREVEPFFIDDNDIDEFIDELEDDNPIKQAIEGAQSTYYKWKDNLKNQHLNHDCTNEIYSFFKLRDVAKSEIAQAKKGFDETFYSMQQRMGI